MKVLIALSGGPESLVTAWLLKKQGMALRGVFLDLENSPETQEKMSILERKLGFAIQVMQVKDEISAFISAARDESFKKGRLFDVKTYFHQSILFPKLFEIQEAHQFAKIATGHRVFVQEDPAAGISRVMRYSDPLRDESRFLIGLNQKQLSSLIMPLGSIPENMMSKLSSELDPNRETTSFDLNWESFESSLVSSMDIDQNGFEIFDVLGSPIGFHREVKPLVLGGPFRDPNQSSRSYRVVEISYVLRKILVSEDPERVIEEVQFEDGYWFTQSDLKFKTLSCGLSWPGREKHMPIELIQYEGNRLRGRLEQPLRGEEANIFKGQTVLWIEGQEVLGGGRVYRTK